MNVFKNVVNYFYEITQGIPNNKVVLNRNVFKCNYLDVVLSKRSSLKSYLFHT